MSEVDGARTRIRRRRFLRSGAAAVTAPGSVLVDACSEPAPPSEGYQGTPSPAASSHSAGVLSFVTPAEAATLAP